MKGVDVVYTDTWTSMGAEAEAEVRRAAFQGWQVDDALMAVAGPDAVFMHCLPAHRGEEVTDAVLDGPASVVWQQAANRMDAKRALFAFLMQEERLMATLGKPQRQHRIARMLEEQAISSQGQLVELLAAEGVLATQATVSRDLEDLGAVKVRIPGGTMAYAVPEHSKDASQPRRPPAPGDGGVRGRRGALREPRRAAHAARLGARGRPPRSTAPGYPDVLGTVAGDDTLLLVCAEAAAAARLRSPAGHRPDARRTRRGEAEGGRR